MTRREHLLAVGREHRGLCTPPILKGSNFLAAVHIPQEDRILPGTAHPHTARSHPHVRLTAREHPLAIRRERNRHDHTDVPERADLPAAGRIPQPHRPVITAGEHLLAVPGKSHACDGAGMPKLQNQGRPLVRHPRGIDNLGCTRRALEQKWSCQPDQRKLVLAHGEPPCS